MRRSGLLGMVLCSALAACDGGGTEMTGRDGGGGPGGDGGGMPAMDELPCGVQAVIRRNCLGCHLDPPILGAPMPLTSYEATHSPARSVPSSQVFELMRIRINSEVEPMPPAPAILPDADREILNAWIDSGAPPRPAGESCGGVDGGTTDGGGGVLDGVGPEHLPCTPSHTFTAHAGGSDAPFAVPADAGNLYQCFTFASPFGAGAQATAWAPIIDDDRVVHHWILYRTETPQTDGAVGPCNMPADAEFLMGWAPGGQNAVLPADVGLELPAPDGWLILQVHYWNVAGITGSMDSSGVAMCTTNTPRANEAAIMWLGSIDISIPPRAMGHTVTGNCPSSVTNFLPEPMYILGNGPHMHELGTEFTTTLFRGGDRGSAETLAHVDPWDFNSQTFYWHDEPIVLNPGDSLETTCVYDNPGDSTVTFGERTEDEMCFDFMMVYPTRAFIGDQRKCLL